MHSTCDVVAEILAQKSVPEPMKQKRSLPKCSYIMHLHPLTAGCQQHKTSFREQQEMTGIEQDR